MKIVCQLASKKIKFNQPVVKQTFNSALIHLKVSHILKICVKKAWIFANNYETNGKLHWLWCNCVFLIVGLKKINNASGRIARKISHFGNVISCFSAMRKSYVLEITAKIIQILSIDLKKNVCEHLKQSCMWLLVNTFWHLFITHR